MADSDSNSNTNITNTISSLSSSTTTTTTTSTPEGRPPPSSSTTTTTPPRPLPGHWLASPVVSKTSTTPHAAGATLDTSSNTYKTTASNYAAPADAIASSRLLNAHLPPHNSSDGDSSSSAIPFRAHIRHPTAAGLQLQTDISSLVPHAESRIYQYSTDNLEGSTAEGLRHAATAPITIQEGGHLRTALSTASMTGSLSPGSALSSPALNALSDLTPLPSPLVMSDSPGPWNRAGLPQVPRSRGASSASSKDDSFAMLSRGTLSPSPSLKKKGYQRLQAAAVEAAAANLSRNDKSRDRNRSISEFTPEALHNIRPRHVTISNIAPEQAAPEQDSENHLHREAYLAAQRGLVSTTAPKGLPTPPASNASNASNRSMTESEGEDTSEDHGIQYIRVRHGSQKTKRLWRPVRQLGQGTFSKVYLATSEKVSSKDPLDESVLDPHKLVAIKVCEHGPAGGADEERVELSLKREVEMLRSICHPSLVHLKAFDHDEAQALLVLTYCPGGDLFDVASAHRELLGPDIVQRIFAEMVSAVRYLHNKLIVHRDIKLENVLLNIPTSTVPLLKHPQSHPFPIATLTDLGLSRRIPAPPESPLLTTRCGSEDYAAPEILLGQPYDGRATDSWALGVVLYALMEGRLPFDPPPGKVGSRSRAAHRIARCDWVWVKYGDNYGEWDPEKGKEWNGARECVEALLKKASRGRKSLDEIEKMEWVQQGIQVEGGVRRRIEDEEEERSTGDITAR